MPCVRRSRACFASPSSFVSSRPASPNAPRFLLGKNEKQPAAPSPPSSRDLYDAPIACAASSTTGMYARAATSRIGSMSALRPNR